jgi:hypothetical protein
MFALLKKQVVLSKNKLKQAKVQRAMLLLLFSKLDELRKQQLRLCLRVLVGLSPKSDERTLINKSGTQTNLSFNLLNNNESVLVNKNLALDNYFNFEGSTQKLNYQTQISKLKTMSKSSSQGARKNYATSQNTADKQIKPKLNDYLNYSPHS